MANDYKSRVAQDIEQAKKILRGEAPAQATKGVMTNAERRASIAKAFGAKPFGPSESATQDTGKQNVAMPVKSSNDDVGVPLKFGNNYQSSQD